MTRRLERRSASLDAPKTKLKETHNVVSDEVLFKSLGKKIRRG